MIAEAEPDKATADEVMLRVRVLLSETMRIQRRIYRPKAGLDLSRCAGFSPRLAFIFHREEDWPHGHRAIMSARVWLARRHAAIKAKLR